MSSPYRVISSFLYMTSAIVSFYGQPDYALYLVASSLYFEISTIYEKKE